MSPVITHLYVQLLWYDGRMLQWRTNNRVDHTYNGLKSPRIRMLGGKPSNYSQDSLWLWRMECWALNQVLPVDTGIDLDLARMGSIIRAWCGRNFLQSLFTTSVPLRGKNRKQPEAHPLRVKQDMSMKPVCVLMMISKWTPEVFIESWCYIQIFSAQCSNLAQRNFFFWSLRIKLARRDKTF